MASLAVIEGTVSNLTTTIAEYEEERSNLINQRDDLLHQLNMSDGNASILLDEIATLDSEIEDLDDQLSGLTSELSKKRFRSLILKTLFLP